MGYPRSLLVDSAAPGVYHCISRCVRRAFLCGEDLATGRRMDHRKQWIENRLLVLADSFAVSVLAYAVMSNHVHLVLQVDPRVAWSWGAQEVARRWLQVFPLTCGGEIDAEGCRRRAEALAGNDERIAVLRERLSNLSWFMRCLSEPIARLANREDGCTGRFWEGRFKCQALLDDAAVLACMTYVDLNPVRAGIAEDLPSSDHTSIQRRLAKGALAVEQPIDVVAGLSVAGQLPINVGQYLELVDWTGRQCHPGKQGRIPESAPRVLHRVATEADWLRQVRGIESRYWRAVGSAQALIDKAQAMGQRWLKLRSVPVPAPA